MSDPIIAYDGSLLGGGSLTTVTDLLTQIGYRIRTSSRNFVTNTEINYELNRSLNRLSTKVSVYQNTQTITLTGTSTTVALNSDFDTPISLYDNTNKVSYKRVNPDTRSYTANTGVNNYCISGGNIIINSQYTSATLTLTYNSNYDAVTTLGVYQKGLQSASDQPILNEKFWDYFVEDVAAVIFRKERKYDDYKIAKAEANNILDDIFDYYPDKEERVFEEMLTYGDIENFN